WLELMASLQIEETRSIPVFADLIGHYCDRERHYHTVKHLAAVLRSLAGSIAAARDRAALLLAAWFHDVIYDPRASDNEERSGAYAAKASQGLGVTEERIRRICALILLTRTHTVSDDDVDGQLLLDADLAILGADPDEYDRYAGAIREE